MVIYRVIRINSEYIKSPDVLKLSDERRVEGEDAVIIDKEYGLRRLCRGRDKRDGFRGFSFRVVPSLRPHPQPSPLRNRRSDRGRDKDRGQKKDITVGTGHIRYRRSPSE